MARKTNLQKQREINLRGRSIARNENLEAQEENNASTETETLGILDSVCAGIMGDSHGKTKDINAMMGIPVLDIDTEEEEGEYEETNPETDGAKQSINMGETESG
ncbi:hypothetical protein vseg_003480 [Gypsophila vaccaria]